MKQTRKSFWDFSVQVYSKPAISKLCLTMQDNHGVDVNQMFFCCWYGCYYGEFSEEIFDTSMEFSATWSKEVVIPLRKTRTWMKSLLNDDSHYPAKETSELREQIKQVELAAEQLQENILESLAQEQPDELPGREQQIVACAKNIKRYFESLNIVINDEVQDQVNTILAAVMDE